MASNAHNSLIITPPQFAGLVNGKGGSTTFIIDTHHPAASGRTQEYAPTAAGRLCFVSPSPSSPPCREGTGAALFCIPPPLHPLPAGKGRGRLCFVPPLPFIPSLQGGDGGGFVLYPPSPSSPPCREGTGVALFCIPPPLHPLPAGRGRGRLCFVPPSPSSPPCREGTGVGEIERQEIHKYH